MSTIGGPNILEDGLVLYLDAANIKSFRGEPTVNLGYDNGAINWSLVGLGGTSIITTTIIPNSRYIITSTGGIGQFRMIFPLSKLTNGLVYNLSFKYRMLQGDSFIYNDWCDVSVASNRIIEDRGDYFFQSAHQSRATYDNTFRFADFNLAVGSSVEIWDIQLEQRNYATPFVNGTRGTTVATGGGWADRSGNNNHGELVNGPTFNSDNLGSLVFDGVDDYSRLSSNIFTNSLPNFSISIWYKNNSNGILLGNHFHNSTWESIWTSNTLFLVNGANNNTTNRQSLSFNSPSFGTWNNIVFINSSSLNYMKVFNNGVEIATRTATVIPWNSSVIPTIGAQLAVTTNAAISPINGNISQVKIYNRALSPEEVLQSYRSTKGRYGL